MRYRGEHHRGRADAQGELPNSLPHEGIDRMSGYVERNVNPGEAIEYRGRASWAAVLHRGITILIISFVLAALAGHSSALSGVAGLGFIIAIASLVEGFMFRKTSEYAVTDRRVIAKYGWIRHRSVDVLMTHISGVSVSMTTLGRIFGYGTVWVNGAGTRSSLLSLGRPRAFQSAVHHRLDESRLLKGTAAYTLDVRVASHEGQHSAVPSPASGVGTASATARFCRQCGNKLSPSGPFCEGCGSRAG